ncbi:S26 family signal peptidase [Streptomonospora wellingtoniae]|uniref:S26 family signal peptidase n=1 Tax=Streptomonospora wellingtoniae TaxID=3075544 RepID=A0ABU2KT42_9ACTN|nr:S26 family signal peptidase [Streptomonospora sp. DSM 45055]MDT0302459.1 S26 family signal peptidase [Streptomonospora sp. DSM 45055]
MVVAGTGAAVVLAALATLWWAGRRYAAVTVEGHSMRPALDTGDRVLIRRGARRAGRGSIVVVARPRIQSGWKASGPVERRLADREWSIKRVAAVAGDPYPEPIDRPGLVPEGHIAVLGDNPVSVDSKHHGPCPQDQVLGVVVRRLGSRAARPSAAGAGAGAPQGTVPGHGTGRARDSIRPEQQ